MIFHKRKRPSSPYLSYRTNIYNQRVDNNITKQFNEIHKNKPETIIQTITDAEGLRRAYLPEIKIYLSMANRCT